MEFRPILSTLLRSRTGPLLVALQVAISLAILANAVFVVQQRVALSQRPTGVTDEENVGTISVVSVEKRPHALAIAEQRRELDVIKAVPGVVAAAWASQTPLSRSGSTSGIRVTREQPRETAAAGITTAHPGFVQALGLKIAEGRDLDDSDVVENDPATMRAEEGQPDNALVTKALAKMLYPDADTYVGKTFWIGENKPTRIVGVIEKLQTPGAGTTSGEYSVVWPQRISIPFNKYAIRAEPGQIDKVLGAAAEALRKSAPGPIRTVTRTLDEDRVNRYRNDRALAWMLVTISVLLLLVTVSGIVGMTALRVAQRRKQIGVRRALGARWRDILRYFIVENVIITSGGIVAGLLLAVGLNRLLMAQLNMARLPLEYLAFGAAALWVLGICAVYGPASKAANISPAIATRTA